MKTLLIAVDPGVALYAEECGVDSIFVDLETRGKAERQGHLDTHRSAHSLADVERLAKVLTRAELLVRLNPPWERTPFEVSEAVDAGAQRLMLPMFRHIAEVRDFKEAAAHTPITLLVETAAALTRLPEILPLLGSEDLIHFGLNDLGIDMRLGFLFEVLAGRLLDGPAALCRSAGVAFGIGGVGRVGSGALPAEWILGEHARLGSGGVILSRAFHGRATSLAELKGNVDLAVEVSAVRNVMDDWRGAHPEVLEENYARLARKVAEISGGVA